VTVVYLSSSAQLGGAEWCLLDVMATVRDARPAWTLELIVPAGGPLAERAASLGLRVRVVPMPGSVSALGDAAAGGPAGRRVRLTSLAVRGFLATPAALGYLRRLGAAIRDRRPGIVHANGLKMMAASALVAPPRVRLLWHLHDYLGDRPVSRPLLRLWRRRVSLLLANSNSVADDAVVALGSVPISVLHNAIDLQEFRPDGPVLDLDRLAGIEPPAGRIIRVGLVATFARWKGHDVFLQAIARCPREVPLRAYVIGSPQYETRESQFTVDELQSLANSLGIEDRVAFTGFLSKRGGALRALDIAVHASTRREPFGLAIAEAMACGRAAIVSAAGGALEVANPDADSLGHPPGNALALARCIVRLATDEHLRTRLGEAARRAAVRRFDRCRLGRKLVTIYERYPDVAPVPRCVAVSRTGVTRTESASLSSNLR
jgi:glycosyltransferase involved in cell wall biosynthesis